MAFSYYGKTVAPSDIAAALGDGPEDSISILDMFFGPVDSCLSKWQFSFGHYIGTWDFHQYAEMIEAGKPVIVSTFGIPGHTLVVVGYSIEAEERYLYVHDPSGYLSRLAWGIDRVKFAKINWSLFSKSTWTQLIIIS